MMWLVVSAPMLVVAGFVAAVYLYDRHVERERDRRG